MDSHRATPTAPALLAATSGGRARTIPAGLWQRPVAGYGIAAGSTFADVVDAGVDRTTLLVFLRHYG